MEGVKPTWESWMDEMKGFYFDSGNSGTEIQGYGFPQSLDEEKDRSLADVFSGIGCLNGIIESKSAGRMAVKYDVHAGGGGRDQIYRRKY